ncbi:transposase [Spirillospora sp. NPDC000708]
MLRAEYRNERGRLCAVPVVTPMIGLAHNQAALLQILLRLLQSESADVRHAPGLLRLEAARPVPPGRQDRALTETIAKIQARSRRTYGAPRVHAELRLRFGVPVGRKQVARLMRTARLEGVRRRRRGLTRRAPSVVPRG